MMDESLLQDFIVETSEHLEEIEKNLLKLSSGQEDSELLNDIFRSIHTIKGSSEYLGMIRIADLSHRMENLLDKMRQKTISYDEKVIDTLIAGTDRIALLMEELSQKGTEESDIDDLIKHLEIFVDSKEEGKEEGLDEKSSNLDRQNLKGEFSSEKNKNNAIIFTDVTYEEDYDTELFEIFIEQLYEGLEFLRDKAQEIIGGKFEKSYKEVCLKKVRSLYGSANYMGYDELAEFYDKWCAELDQNSDIHPKNIARLIAVVVGMFPKAIELKQLMMEEIFSQEDFSDAKQIIGEPIESTILADDEREGRLLLEEDDSDEEKLSVEKKDLSVEDNLLDIEDERSIDLEEDQTSELMPVDDSLLNDFIAETGEHLDEIEANLLRLSSGPDDSEMLNSIFRSIHTIKGSSEYLGMEQISKLSHRMESLLDQIRNKEVSIDEIIIDTLISGRDRIGMLIEELSHFGSEKSEVDDIIERIDNLGHPGIQHEYKEDVIEGESEGLSTFDGTDGYNYSKSYSDVVYEEDSDVELFEIFIEQLNEGLSHIKDFIIQLATGSATDTILGECIEKLEALKTSANYMGYDRLAEVYEDWSNEFPQSISVDNSETEIKGLLEKFNLKISIISSMFPKASALVELIEYDTLKAFREKSQWEKPEKDEEAETIGTIETEAMELSDITESLNFEEDAVLDLEDSLAPAEEDAVLDLEDSLVPAEEDAVLDLEDSLSPADDELIELSEIVTDDYYKTDPKFAEQTNELIEKLEGVFDVSDELENEIDEKKYETKEIFSVSSADEFSDKKTDTLSSTLKYDELPIPSHYTEEMIASLRAEFDLENVDLASAIDKPVVSSEKKDDEKDQEKSKQFDAKDSKPGRRLSQSVRVDAGKIDMLMNQVGELVVNRAVFSQLYNEMRGFEHYLKQNDLLEGKDFNQIKDFTYRLSEATLALGRVANDLQDKVMRVRMLPISQLFNRYPRLVHDLMKGVNKKVKLDILGEDTELDRMVIERISDPLVHIIRNSIDHGIETVTERVRKGKSATGTLRLEAYHESNHVVIKVFDDGRGIDIERIKSKALEKKLLTIDEIERMSDREITSLIMQPGFSTASQITHTSGRGVGMDVVKKNVEKLNGTLEVESKFGIYTQIRIKIPLTLAIIPALLVHVGNDLFTIPLSTVDETIRVYSDELQNIKDVEVFNLRDETIPILRLNEFFNTSIEEKKNKDFVVVVRTGEKRVGIVVDDLIGQEEVVIKPLEDYLSENTGFSGATILGDGSISLILDVYELINICEDKQAKKNALNSAL